jgi:uncharacterized surface protein with fasciclin (FAS1) repeats
LYAPLGTIWDVLVATPSFSKLVAALNRTESGGLRDALASTASSSGTFYTLFAPDDSAYADLGASFATSSAADDPAVVEVLYR